MACETLPAAEQACVNIPLVRGDDYEITYRIWEDDAKTIPLDLSLYAIKMEIRQGGGDMWSPVSTRTESDMDINGNDLTLRFNEDDPVYARNYRTLFYDIAFTRISDGWVSHWIKGQILITKSETKTW